MIPAAYLIDESLRRMRFAGISTAIVCEAINTIVISLLATVLTVGAGVVVVYAMRVDGGAVPAALSRLASLGYAVPGTVLAIGLLPVVSGVEMAVDAAARVASSGSRRGCFLLGTGAAIVYAYLVRFLAIASGGIEAGFSRVSPSLDDAARTLGETVGGRLRRIHLPLLRPALATAALLVFVDCMKELPATLLLAAARLRDARDAPVRRGRARNLRRSRHRRADDRGRRPRAGAAARTNQPFGRVRRRPGPLTKRAIRLKPDPTYSYRHTKTGGEPPRPHATV